jgi:hypothetical protein
LNIVYIEQILNKYQHHPNTEGFAVVKNIYDLLNDIINRFNDFVHLKQNYDWADFINEYFDKYTK